MKKFLTVAGLAAGAVLVLVSTPAMARVDVAFNFAVPGAYVQSAPVYVQQRPVYVQPRPIYVEAQPVLYVVEQPYRHEWHGSPRREQQWHRTHWRGHGNRDYDGDGVPNRYDHQPNNPHRY